MKLYMRSIFLIALIAAAIGLIMLPVSCSNVFTPDEVRDARGDTTEEESDSDNGDNGDNGDELVAVTGVIIDPVDSELPVDDVLPLFATIEPADATNQNVSWVSDNEAIATVSETGVVTGLSVGSATVTVTTDDGGYTDTVTITVVEAVVGVTGIQLTKGSTSLLVDGSEQLNYTIEPADADNQAVSWSSDDETVVTVSDAGLLTGVGAGSTTVTVTTNDGGFTDTIAVTVASEEVDVTGVAIDQDNSELTEGDSLQLSATIAPANATNQNISWSSSNDSVATVSSSGLVSAVAAGTADITVITDDGDHTDIVTVTVVEPTGDLVIEIEFVGPSVPEVTLTLSGQFSQSSEDETVTTQSDGEFTIAADRTVDSWRINAELADGQDVSAEGVLTFTAASHGAGEHNLTLRYVVDDQLYSVSLTVVVQE